MPTVEQKTIRATDTPVKKAQHLAILSTLNKFISTQ